MKIRHVIALCGFLYSGVSVSFAQSSGTSSPFDLSVTNLDFDHFPIFVPSLLQTNGASNGASFLGILFEPSFETKAKAKVDALFTDDHLPRYNHVCIVDGGHVLAEGKVVGRFHRSGGLILAFDSVAGAQQASVAIKKSIAENHFDELMQRHKRSISLADLGDWGGP